MRNFSSVPSVHVKRHNFNLTHRVSTSMQVGKLTPIDVVEVLPGDTWDSRYNFLCRMTGQFVRPIMDDIFLDTYSFFVPLRLCQSNLEDVFGDSSPSAYSSPQYVEIASLKWDNPPSGWDISPRTVPDYLGIPPSSSSFSYSGGTFSVLKMRAFALIWNEYFRSQQVDNETFVSLADSPSTAEVWNNLPWSETNYFGKLPPVQRYKDYFSSAFVAPQKGPSVTIPGLSPVPVVTSNTPVISGAHPSLRFRTVDGLNPTTTRHLLVSPISSSVSQLSYSSTQVSDAVGNAIYPDNLVTSPSDDGTISALRTAFQFQKYLERDSIYGSRYREYLYSAFGVISSDARMQVPEFLSGSHNRLNIQQVISTSASNVDDSTQSLGSVGAMSQTLSSKDGHFRKRFTEHGYVITVACIRYKHLYSQSVDRSWRRVDRSDFYDPLFANLSMQPVYADEIYAGVPVPSDEDVPVLGYQEAFADYRTIFDRVSGQMRPSPGSLGQFWSLADYFTSAPALSDLIHENSDSIFRLVTGIPTDGSVDPFIVDYSFQQFVKRPVVPFGKPGLADHH